jgi:hypothetical protein
MTTMMSSKYIASMVRKPSSTTRAGRSSSTGRLNNSSIIEVNHRSSKGIVYRTGTLSGQHAISWSEPQEIDGTKDHYYPAITADATDTVLTFHSGEEGIFRSVYLRYSTAKLP